MSLRLSRGEITELCWTPRKVRQLAFLRQNGIATTLGAYGWPVITRAAVEGEPEREKPQQPWVPNKAKDLVGRGK